ncbi:hypothetical protein [Acidiferrobacter sp.]|uniref:COG4648 family protein n=1 Tax=Acidiferrobacter sp. TaxID=1872107 RepID=UPI0026390223|nr:hypothetical protein [Acidiferrobacter sp.]
MEAHKITRWFGKIRAIAVATAFLVYPVVSYRATVATHRAAQAALLALLPVLVVTLAMAWAGRPRSLRLGAWGLLTAVAWHDRAFMTAHYSWLYLGENVGMMVLLCGLFARSLRPSRTPLISRLSLLMRGSLSPLLARYTRRVTALWAGLFGALAIVSLLLFFEAGIRIWAFYANILMWPIMVFVFVGEYLVRLAVVPAEERAGFLQVVLASQRHWRNLIAGTHHHPGSCRRLSP